MVPPPHALTIRPQFRYEATHSSGCSGLSQRLPMPRAPHEVPLGQPPQLAMPPQPLLMRPQVAPAAAQMAESEPGVQVGSHLCSAVLQLLPEPQLPQLVVLVKGPQPSQTWPHS